MTATVYSLVCIFILVHVSMYVWEPVSYILCDLLILSQTYCTLLILVCTMSECVYVCMWGRKREYVCVQRLRALFCTGAIKDTLEKERDYRKKGVFFLTEKTNNKSAWVWEATRQSFTWCICLVVLQMQQFIATYIFKECNRQFDIVYWGQRNILQPPVYQTVSCEGHDILSVASENKNKRILKYSPQPSHSLFTPMPSGKR